MILLILTPWYSITSLVILISLVEDFHSPSVTVIDSVPVSLIISHDLTSLPLNLIDTVQFSVLSSVRDAISSLQSKSLLPDIVICISQ